MSKRTVHAVVVLVALLGSAFGASATTAAAAPLRQELLKANPNWSPLEIVSYPNAEGQLDPDSVVVNEVLPLSPGSSPCKPLTVAAGVTYVNQSGTFTDANGRVGFDPLAPAEQGTATDGQKLTVCRAFITRGQTPASVPPLDPNAAKGFCAGNACSVGLPVAIGPNSFQFVPQLGVACAAWKLPAGYVLVYAKGATEETVVVGPKKITPKLWFGTCPTIWIFRIA